MEAEFADAFSSAQSSKQLSEIARYQTLINEKISRNFQVEPNMKGKTCKLRIKLTPDGLVISVKQNGGDQRVCESAERAAYRAKTLPIPKDPEIATQFRDFDLTFTP
jgi:colicin import membrane protein